MEAFLKGTGKLGKKQVEKELAQYQQGLFPPPDADLAWHVRAWGWWVLQQARKDLERFYPTIDGKPTVAYLSARTVTCKNCRATIPLLKTRWLCKKENKRVVLTMEPNADKTSVVFGVQNNVPVVGGNAAQKRDYDAKTAGGTMSRAGVTCPCCSLIMTGEDIRLEASTGRLGALMTSVVFDGRSGKEYRLPTTEEVTIAEGLIDGELMPTLPFGPLDEPIPKGGSRVGGGSPFTIHLYGFDTWGSLFTRRQTRALATFAVQHEKSALRWSDTDTQRNGLRRSLRILLSLWIVYALFKHRLQLAYFGRENEEHFREIRSSDSMGFC